MKTHQPAEISTPSNIFKFPCLARRRLNSRKPRRSKNGTPEERAARAAAEAAELGKVIPLSSRQRTPPEAVLLTAEEAATAYGQISPDAQRVISAMVDEALAKKGLNGKPETDVDDAQVSPADTDGWFRRFAQRIRAARVALGISDKEAAAAAGKSVLTWRRYEATGRGRLTLALARFAKHYGLSIEDLLCEEAPAPSAAPDPACVLSETGRNERLRLDRREVWRRAECKLDYWKAYKKLHLAIYRNREELDGLDCPKALLRMHGNFAEPWVLDNELNIRMHVAEVAMLLTPAPDVASLNWKRQRMEHPSYKVDVDSEFLRRHFGRPQTPVLDIEQAIADDEAWLKAHPARQCHGNKRRRK